ncbi:alpha/beta fold hydrolase [Saccharicrinis aurantiacus]|uniref:alpha/beta fold hydrolase n=1 Tax=Saccharicrinis aurantiacus TaxID=1849719 RepID=UPI00094FB4A9|nr:alpha/beta fold hydrolase [Saccharicrinis aurantiacus]
MSVQLFYRKLGENGAPLIIIHGLYGASDNWLTIAKQLQDKFRVYIVDQRNHGQSPHTEEMNYDVMADDIKQLMLDENLDTATIIGHSMGGKTAMTLALKYPELVDKLVVLDIAPKSYGNYSNYAKITNDHQNIIDALLSVKPDEYKSRSAVDKYLAPKITNTMVRSFLLKNITRNADGTLMWKLNIKVLAENLELIMAGFSDKNYKEFDFNKTVAFINGEKSPYILEEDLQLVRNLFPSAQTATIPNAGHWLHAEQPELFLKTLLYFID